MLSRRLLARLASSRSLSTEAATATDLSAATKPFESIPTPAVTAWPLFGQIKVMLDKKGGFGKAWKAIAQHRQAKPNNCISIR